MLAENIRTHRERKALTRKALAFAIGLADPTAIYLWEKGLRQPSIENVRKLAEAFEISMEALDPDGEGWNTDTRGPVGRADMGAVLARERARIGAAAPDSSAAPSPARIAPSTRPPHARPTRADSSDRPRGIDAQEADMHEPSGIFGFWWRRLPTDEAREEMLDAALAVYRKHRDLSSRKGGVPNA